MSNLDDLVRQLARLDTERINPDTVDIDRLTAAEICRKINNEDKKVAPVVEGAISDIARAAEEFASAIRRGGRVFLIGAGTSGRLGVLDAAECPPTFGTDPEQIVGLIAGGYATLILSREGVEDSREEAVAALKEKQLTRDDFVIGITASRRTPFTLSALAYAKDEGCQTALIICNRSEDLEIAPGIVISLPVGPEVIAGSTRMKSGTAQKMALNMISTTAMVLLGKTFGNIMVDLQCRSEKLEARARKILMDLFSLNFDDAHRLLSEAHGSTKVAIVMHRLNCSEDEAKSRLEAAGGFISRLWNGA